MSSYVTVITSKIRLLQKCSHPFLLQGPIQHIQSWVIMLTIIPESDSDLLQPECCRGLSTIQATPHSCGVVKFRFIGFKSQPMRIVLWPLTGGTTYDECLSVLIRTIELSITIQTSKQRWWIQLSSELLKNTADYLTWYFTYQKYTCFKHSKSRVTQYKGRSMQVQNNANFTFHISSVSVAPYPN